MTFFENQKQAKKKTSLLIFLFSAAIAVMILSIYSVLRIILFKGSALGFFDNNLIPENFWNLELFAIIALPTIAIIALGSAWRIYQLSSGGGKKIAELMGGRPLLTNTTDPDEKKLLNVVEEMSIASGLAVPLIYILDYEPGINAFVSGSKPNESVLSVSRGAMQLLNRDELQGVIAHEFSHIFNGDVRLNIKLLGFLNGLLVIALFGELILRLAFGKSRSRRSKDNFAPHVALIGFALVIIGHVGVFFASLIQLAVSREREYLADASAVQFTRLDSGITGALKKIGGLESRSYLKSPYTSTTSHMLFADGIKHRFTSLFSTHPPLVDRIKKIEPTFSGHFPKVIHQADRVFEELNTKALDQQLEKLTEQNRQVAARGGEKSASNFLPQNEALKSSEQIINLVGVMTASSLLAAQDFLKQQTPLVKELVHEPSGAMAVVYMALFDKEEHYRNRQISLVRNYETKAVIDALNKLIWSKVSLSENKFALIELCYPALQRISPAQYREFLANLRRIMKVDSHISIFEYSLYTGICANLNKAFGISSGSKKKLTPESGLFTTVSALLAQLAALTGHSPTEAFESYLVAAKSFQLPADHILSEENFPQGNLEEFDLSLSLVENISTELKEPLLNACTKIVMHNNSVSMGEYELIRTIANRLYLPMPMLAN